MVFVTVGQHDAADFILVALNVGEIGQNEVDLKHVSVREGHAAVQEEHIVPALEQGHILPISLSPPRKVTLIEGAGFSAAPRPLRCLLGAVCSAAGALSRLFCGCAALFSVLVFLGALFGSGLGRGFLFRAGCFSPVSLSAPPWPTPFDPARRPARGV